MKRLRLAGIGLLAAGIVAATCNEGGISQCFEPIAAAYHFSLPGSDSLVFNWRDEQPVTVYAEPPAGFQGHVDTAISMWRGAFRCGELNISRTTDSNTADIIVRRPDVIPPTTKLALAAFDSTSACTGVTPIDTANGDVLRPIRVYVVPSSFEDSADVEGCFRFVTTHELGHALGLFQHSPDPNDLMHSAPFRRVLTEVDRHTVQILYHTAPTMGAAPR